MDYSSYYDTSAGSGSSAGSMVISLLIYAVMVLANWFLFEKAGEPGWKSLIPGLNVWTMFEITYGAVWKCLLLLVPVLSIAVSIMYPFRQAQAYGQGIGFGFLNFFLSPVANCIMAFSGNIKYYGPCGSFL